MGRESAALRRRTWTGGLGATWTLDDPNFACAERRRVPGHFVPVRSESDQISDRTTINGEARARIELAPGEDCALLLWSDIPDQRKPPAIHGNELEVEAIRGVVLDPDGVGNVGVHTRHDAGSDQGRHGHADQRAWSRSNSTGPRIAVVFTSAIGLGCRRRVGPIRLTMRQ